MVDDLLEIHLIEDDNFLKIKETLTRIGVVSRDNKLTQTCHILHKRGKYYVCHFRELFKLDGFERDITEDDLMRRNAIAKLLEEWNLCKIVNTAKSEPSSMKRVKVVPHKEKHLYELKANYTIGGKK